MRLLLRDEALGNVLLGDMVLEGVRAIISQPREPFCPAVRDAQRPA